MEPRDDSSKTNTFDPGWNDPPTFAYTAQPAQPKPRNILNKRVPFPLNSQNTNPTTNAVPLMPPLPSNTMFIPSAVTNLNSQNIVTNASESGDSGGYVDDNVLLQDVMGGLDSLLKSNEELGTKLVDIRKRLSTMEVMWKEGKLNRDIQNRMKNLVNALKSDDPQRAENIQKGLMVDHIGSVSSWMVGIRQLILHCTAKHDLLTIEEPSIE